MRLDTTVVETNIHYPTDSSLLGDGARVLTRIMQKVVSTVGELKQSVRDRMRTVRKKVVGLAIAARRQGAAGGKQTSRLDKGVLQGGRHNGTQNEGGVEEVESVSQPTHTQNGGGIGHLCG